MIIAGNNLEHTDHAYVSVSLKCSLPGCRKSISVMLHFSHTCVSSFHTGGSRTLTAPYGVSSPCNILATLHNQSTWQSDAFLLPLCLSLSLFGCAMASTLFLILDDSTGDFVYGPQNWTINKQPPWYGGTSTYPAFANAQTSGSLEVSFEGA
jgi:hypothetical protein